MAVNYNSKIATDGLIACFDSANPKSFSPNVYPNPTDLYSRFGATGRNLTISRDTIQSPVGNTPAKLIITGDGADPYTYTYGSSIWNICPTVQGDTWNVSLYIKASQTTNCELWLAEANSSGGYLGSTFWTTQPVTTDWTKISASGTVSNAAAAYIQWRFDPVTIGGAGIIFWVDGVQIERGLSATTFNPKTNTNRTNYWDTVSNTVATITGSPSYAQGILTFNGTSQQVTIPYNAKYNFNAEQTIGIWLKPTENDAVRRNPYNQAYGGGGTITHETDGSFHLFCGTSGINAATYSPYNSGFTVLQNETAYITVVRDVRNVYWYKNGTLETTLAHPYGAGVVTGTQDIIIGNGYAGYYQGNIPCVHLYTRALTSKEVNQNFNATRGRYGI